MEATVPAKAHLFELLAFRNLQFEASSDSAQASCSARRRDEDSAVVGMFSMLLTTVIGTPLLKPIVGLFSS